MRDYNLSDMGFKAFVIESCISDLKAVLKAANSPLIRLSAVASWGTSVLEVPTILRFHKALAALPFLFSLLLTRDVLVIAGRLHSFPDAASVTRA